MLFTFTFIKLKNIMFRYLRRISGPIIPILYVDSNINQIKTSNLLKKLKSHKYNFAKGIAIVCSI